jgi:RNase P subunit RPR2
VRIASKTELRKKMKIESRLARLESRARLTLQCDWCRFAAASMPASAMDRNAKQERPGVAVTCNYCGSTVFYEISTTDKFEREALVLFHTAKRGADLRDERVFAATRWFTHRSLWLKWRARYVEPEVFERKRNARNRIRNIPYPEEKKIVRQRREHKEQRERAVGFLKRMHELELERYGARSLALAAEIERIALNEPRGFVRDTYVSIAPESIAARKALYHLQVMEVCERALWQTILPGTETALQELIAIIERIDADQTPQLESRFATQTKKGLLG